MNFRLAVSAAAMIAMSIGHLAAAEDRPSPAHATISFPIREPQPTLDVPIQAPKGNRVYWLSLNPESDIGGNFVVLDLLLSRAKGGQNLLELKGIWHGYQKWTFAAKDFARGPAKSLYGKERIVGAGALVGLDGLEAHIVVLKALAEPSSQASNYKWQWLELQVDLLDARQVKAD
jgi:hypothetical protein